MSLIVILQIIFGASLLGMLFIFLRNLPLLPEIQPELNFSKGIFFKFRYNLKKIKTKIGEIFHKITEKNAHRLRIFTLKADNFLMSRTKKARERKIHFAKINFKRKKREDYLLKIEDELKEKEKKVNGERAKIQDGAQTEREEVKTEEAESDKSQLANKGEKILEEGFSESRMTGEGEGKEEEDQKSELKTKRKKTKTKLKRKKRKKKKK